MPAGIDRRRSDGRGVHAGFQAQHRRRACLLLAPREPRRQQPQRGKRKNA
jgi:hypothetical protein